MKPGTWRPAAITPGNVNILIGIAYVDAIVRVLDYSSGDDRTSQAALVALTLAPLPLWAAVIAVGAGFLLLGWARRIHTSVWLGHLILAGAYSGITGGALGYTITSATTTHGWAFDGSSVVAPIALITALHWIIVVRTGPTPIDPDREVIAERTVAEPPDGDAP